MVAEAEALRKKLKKTSKAERTVDESLRAAYPRSAPTTTTTNPHREMESMITTACADVFAKLGATGNTYHGGAASHAAGSEQHHDRDHGAGRTQRPERSGSMPTGVRPRAGTILDTEQKCITAAMALKEDKIIKLTTKGYFKCAGCVFLNFKEIEHKFAHCQNKDEATHAYANKFPSCLTKK